jgi:arsenite/tail-anchored protein-transporting ATPase
LITLILVSTLPNLTSLTPLLKQQTSSAAALGVKFADEGYDTVVVSTDPAHSLGDALLTDLKHAHGELTPIPGVIAGGGRLYALEVDTEGSLNEFKEVNFTVVTHT